MVVCVIAISGAFFKKNAIFLLKKCKKGNQKFSKQILTQALWPQIAKRYKCKYATLIPFVLVQAQLNLV